MPARVPLLLALLLLLHAAAAAATPAEAWLQGQTAYAAQAYQRALSWFEQARDGGQAGPAVHYNIAVCHYKLGNYNQAAQGFTLLNDRYPALRPLARYNLGLAALKQSQPESAARHFRESYRLSGDEPKLRAMSSTMLRRLIGEPVPSSSWVRTVSMRGGYDDNVSLQDKTGLAADVSPDSPFVELFGTIRGPYAGRSGFRLDGAVFLLRYTDAEDFDQLAAQLGGLYDWRGGDSGLQLGAHFSTTLLGGDSYDRSGRLSARISRDLTSTSSVGLRYRFDEVRAGDAVFDGIEGSRQRVDVHYRWRLDARSINLGAALEGNDRRDPAVSPNRVKLRADYRYMPDTGWGFMLGGEIRSSEYEDASLRDEDLVQLDIGVSRSFSSWQVLAQYTFAENDSSDPAFSYTRNRISIGAFRFF